MTHEKEQSNPPSPPPPAEAPGVCAEPKAGTGGSPCETEEAWIGDVWLDGSPYDPCKPDPFDEARLPEDGGPPYPPGLADPLSPDLIDAARNLLRWVLGAFWSSPRWMMWVGEIWQWRKFEFLDWLRPLELLLRRLVMIEALSLLASQALPHRKHRSATSKTGKAASAAEPPVPKPRPAHVCDPDHPESWKISFTVIPRGPRPGRRLRARNPAIRNYWYERDRLGFEKKPLRYRRALHPALPLAKRLEAVIRVVTNPAPFARRVAFRLRARASLNADLLLADLPKPRVRLATDALQWARDRLAQLYGPIWEQYWSSA